MIQISVIICTHNPRPDYLDRVLKALREQSLPKDQWELLIIDNASTDTLAKKLDPSWHPLARHIRENELGLTPARLRGIAEANGNLLVFVDDDNVLDRGYLENASEIGRNYPFLGAWGGIIRGEFETVPEEWMSPLLGYLGIREFSHPVWSNNREDWRPQPCGAGLCVRKTVAIEYKRLVSDDPARRRLGRVGSKLSSCEDSDLVQTSTHLGLGFGNFPKLCLTHLIPSERLQVGYLGQLIQGITISSVLLRYFHTGELPPEHSSLKVWVRYFVRWVRQGRREAWLYKTTQNAIGQGLGLALGLDSSRTHCTRRGAIQIEKTRASRKDALPDAL